MLHPIAQTHQSRLAMLARATSQAEVPTLEGLQQCLVNKDSTMPV
ncbi:hypothetical protein SynA1562_02370 [Synechococcus sp. A15-62]|nr:hypothetical protein SynA1562_02370 [Synechococcus sp. A15-62]